MPELMVDLIVSLDGWAAADGWPGLWGMGGPDYFAFLGEQEAHTTLMGATTYRLMSGLADEEPEAFAELEAMDKVVFSSTLTEPLAWANTRLVADDPVEAVRGLTQDGPSPLRTLGSLTLARSLLVAGLVDRLRLVVFPVINGATGRERVFDGYPDVRLELVESRTFDGRLQLLEYVPTVLDHPPLS
ncbi:dihydrofolate reductase family protein [Nocardioides sp. STR2]|uniref:Dihydrofolate reductase family protein n=1 Tax=Nocardioides pini TaxID=2975053 RepID=A0ABT4CJW4_9ACTN|nr:dihydrofolate reductase family protein [Nocardioides pini]MCY4728681.1 dihydrofolate reductase family protein [Nocardioides pini]